MKKKILLASTLLLSLLFCVRAIYATQIGGAGHENIDYEHKIDFDLNPTASVSEGRMIWNSDDGTINLGLPGGNVNLQIGQEILVPRRVRNTSGADMLNGQIVYISGGDGNNAYVSLAKADTEVTSANTIAMLTEDIDNNQFGYATTFGLVRGDSLQPINTSSYSPGDTLYLSASISGGFTGTKPTAPDHIVVVGKVFRSHLTDGVVLVDIQNGYEIEELHDVYINNIQNGDVIEWNSINSRWENVPH